MPYTHVACTRAQSYGGYLVCDDLSWQQLCLVEVTIDNLKVQWKMNTNKQQIIKVSTYMQCVLVCVCMTVCSLSISLTLSPTLSSLSLFSLPIILWYNYSRFMLFIKVGGTVSMSVQDLRNLTYREVIHPTRIATNLKQVCTHTCECGFHNYCFLSLLVYIVSSRL